MSIRTRSSNDMVVIGQSYLPIYAGFFENRKTSTISLC